MGYIMERVYKFVGETPLEALERFRVSRPELKDVPMTYAGRLDPMAEGLLLILIGDECKKKEEYLDLDKEYEVEVVFGLKTDTHDALGLVEVGPVEAQSLPDLSVYIGKFTQTYPAYSSKTIHGKHLHQLARTNDLPEEMPTREVEIYSLKLLKTELITAYELKEIILKNIDRVTGDFRQEEIKKRWQDVLSRDQEFEKITLKVSCSSGTYMRSLADHMGNDRGGGAFALSIKRTRIGSFR